MRVTRATEARRRGGRRLWLAGGLLRAELVARLAALHPARAAEEAAGTVRGLRSDYRVARFGDAGET